MINQALLRNRIVVFAGSWNQEILHYTLVLKINRRYPCCFRRYVGRNRRYRRFFRFPVIDFQISEFLGIIFPDFGGSLNIKSPPAAVFEPVIAAIGSVIAAIGSVIAASGGL